MNMDISKLTPIIKEFPIEEIEKHLVYNYIANKSIDYTNNQFINSYLDFIVNNELLNKIDKINVESVEDLAILMELLIPSEDKKVNGAFFTPSYIVDFIINTVAPKYDSKIIDPSCGSGAFLLGLLRYYKKTFNKSIRDSLMENIYGADILHYNIKRCQILLSIASLENNENIEVSELNLICCDSLKHKFKIKFEAVVGNPPYVKFQDMDDETREFLLNNYKTTQFGTFNLYFAFFELGLRLLNKDGLLGYITPNNYFTSLAGESLRSFFQNEKCIYKIVDFNATKVFDVQTYTAITFLNKLKNENIKYDRIKDNEKPTEFLNHLSFTDNPYNSLSIKKWRLLCGSERENIYKIENIGETIGNLFNICVGIATLKDDVYFFFPVKDDDKYYYFRRDGLVYPVEKEVTRPVIKISDMKEQLDIFANTRRIVFPYKSEKGKSVPIPEEELKNKYPACYNYLLSVKDILEQRGKGKHTYTPFYSYGRTQGLNRTGVKLLTPTFSKKPRFLFDSDSIGFFTNGYGVYLRDTEYSLFSTNPISLPENLDVMQKILNSYVMEYYVDKTSVAIEGGYPCYQKNFIEKFSIPNLTDDEIEQLREIENKENIDEWLIEKYQLNIELPNLCV